jgi:outer membrane lipoprotein-sorting protein
MKMRGTKRMLLVLAVLAVLSGSVSGARGQAALGAKPVQEKAAAALPTADQIFEKYIQSLGGKTAIEQLKTELQTGTFEGNGGNMPVEIAIKAPNKWRFEIKLPDGNAFKQLSNGEKGWRVDPQHGVEEMTRDHMLLTSRFLNLQGPIHFKEIFTKVEVKGKEKHGGRDCYQIEATPIEGKPQTMFFDVETGFLLSVDFTVEMNQGTFSAGMDFDDYKEVQGVKIPFTLHQVGDEEWTIRFTEILRDIALDDKQFEKPE